MLKFFLAKKKKKIINSWLLNKLEHWPLGAHDKSDTTKSFK